ncbi:ABC transporter permease [Aeromicrobium endophyticum]|uniref:ABC transporter permease n=1 Tax=Aeromicrobium endophyticum TaxID=2292704 RepID=A0A371NYS2_9ACTN|nr:ABC transporter permease [Aeromicrobium endophyticum]REK68842.1 ABC transporter permease [Aeromicrobium endophyticum]
MTVDQDRVELRAAHQKILRDVSPAKVAREYAVLLLSVLLFLYLSFAADNFFTAVNLRNVASQSAILGIMASAATLLIVAGNFDLSVGAIFAASGIVTVLVVESSSMPVGVAAGLLTGMVLGLLNGVIVTRFGVNSFIATLASSLVIGGVILVITGGENTDTTNISFITMSARQFLGLDLMTWVFIVWALLLGYVLARSIYGRYMYAAGGSAVAAQLSGVSVTGIRTATFVVSGLGAAIAGILSASQSGSVPVTAGSNLVLISIAAVVVGGTSIWGGDGAVWRTVVGVVFLSLIDNGFNLLDLDPLYGNIVYGSIILVAAAIDAQARRR